METKICTKCKVELTIDNFKEDKRGKNGLLARCKECTTKYRKEYEKRMKEEHPEILKNRQIQYQKKNSAKLKAYGKKYREKCPEKIKATQNKFYGNKENREKKEKYYKKYYNENKDMIDSKAKKRRDENPHSRDEYFKQYNIDNREILSAKSKKYHAENQEKEKIRRKNFYWEHKKEEKEYYLLHYEEHKEKYKEVSAKWRNENKEKIRLNHVIYYEKNYAREKERSDLYRRSHPIKYCIHAQKYRTKKNSLLCTLTDKQWEDIKLCFDNKCAYCGRKLKLEQEHFIALSKEGEYTYNNIICACRTCNASKSNKDFFIWYKNYKYYSAKREKLILKYLGYDNDIQQLKLI